MKLEDHSAHIARERAAIRSVPAPRIKLMADNGTPPLWRIDGGTGPIPLEELPLSLGLRERLQQWARLYEDLGTRRYAAPAFQPSAAELDAFDEEGRELWQRLREELIGRYSVLYRSEKSGELMAHAADIV